MDYRKLNDHIANIGEELTMVANQIRHKIEAKNDLDYAAGKYKAGADNKTGRLSAYTIDTDWHTGIIVVYGNEELRDDILTFLNHPLKTVTKDPVMPLPTFADIEHYVKLVHARMHDDFMNDGRQYRPPYMEETKLAEWFKSALGSKVEPNWAQPETVYGDNGGKCVAVRDELPALDVYVFRLHFGNGVIDVVRMPGLTDIHAMQDVRAIHSAANRVELIGVEK